MAKFLMAMGLSVGLFGGLVGAFCGSADSITDAMVTHPRGSLVSSLAERARNRGACNLPQPESARACL